MLTQTHGNTGIARNPLNWRGDNQPEIKQKPVAKIGFFFLCCFIFTIPWENVVVVTGIGTISHLVGYVAFGIGILGVLDNGRLQSGSTALSLIFLFAIWRTITYFWSPAPDFTLNEIQTTLQIVAMIWLLRQLASTQKLQIRVMQAYVLGTLVSALDTIWQYLSGATPAAYLRYAAPGFDPNELALMMVLSVPLSLYLGVLSQRRPVVWIYRIQLMLAAATVLLTASRGSFVAFVAAMIFIPATFRRWTDRQKSIFIVVALAAVWFAAWLVPASSWKRLSTIQDEVAHGTLNDRAVIWKAGGEIFREHPVLGVGAGAFSTVVRHTIGTPYVAHNTFLSIIVEQGLIGFGVFLSLLITLVLCCFRMPDLERKLWLVMLLVLSIGILSLTWEYRKTMWLIFALISMQEKVLRVRKMSAKNKPDRLQPQIFPYRPAAINPVIGIHSGS